MTKKKIAFYTSLCALVIFVSFYTLSYAVDKQMKILYFAEESNPKIIFTDIEYIGYQFSKENYLSFIYTAIYSYSNGITGQVWIVWKLNDMKPNYRFVGTTRRDNEMYTSLVEKKIKAYKKHKTGFLEINQ